MEVHHHTSTSSDHSSHRGKKKWTHYFWEFLMLFLAVFAGFLAENAREHYIEHQREKQFIRSFIEDLKSDTATINRYINANMEKKRMYDSLTWYLNAPDPNKYGQRIYLFARQLTRTVNFFPADRTIKQLKNSGGLRLIRNQQASDSILSYDQSIEMINVTQTRREDEISDIRPMMGKLMNPNILETMIEGESIHPPAGNPGLRNLDKDFILDFIYAIHQIKGSNAVSNSRLERLKEKATVIIEFLKKEYGMKK